jgi:tRNA-specific 2-thiouridylase
MCAEWGYNDLSKKAESYEICFVPDNDYRGFLKRRVPNLEEQVAGGNFLDIKGNVIGKHNGYPFFTVGQRKGLGTAFGKPMFVTEIKPETNTVVLGEMDDLVKNTMEVYKLNPMKYAQFPEQEAVAHIRYNDPGALSMITKVENDRLEVEFLANVKGVAPGQSAVFYEGDDVIGGGIITGGALKMFG